jgi:hypothetical protein
MRPRFSPAGRHLPLNAGGVVTITIGAPVSDQAIAL